MKSTLTDKSTTLGDIVSFKSGKAIKPKGVGKFPVYGSNGIIGGSDETKHENGVIIGRVGAYCGSVAYCPTPFWASDNTLVAYPASDQVDIRFLFYLLGHADLRNYAGGAAQPLVTQTVLKQVELIVPDLPTQRRIAGILSAYDDLIENNLRRIRILEEMAQSLYREWFVHFRIPSEVLQKAGLPPEITLVDSPLGPIPDGWEVKKVRDILKRLRAGQVYKQADVSEKGAVPVVDQSTDEVLGFHDNEADHFAETENPIVIFGDHTCKMQLMITPFSIGPNVVPFVSQVERPLVYVYYLVRSLAATQEYKRHWTQLNANEVPLAPESLAARFEEFSQPLLDFIERLNRRNQTLRQTRDLLLPKLLSPSY